MGVVSCEEGKSDEATPVSPKTVDFDPNISDAISWTARADPDPGGPDNEYRMMGAPDASSEDFLHFSSFIDSLKETLGEYHQAMTVPLEALLIRPNRSSWKEERCRRVRHGAISNPYSVTDDQHPYETDVV